MMAASITFREMTTLMEKMPIYENYRSEGEAAAAERVYRRAMGYLLKDSATEELVAAVRSVTEGKRYLSDRAPFHYFAGAVVVSRQNGLCLLVAYLLEGIQRRRPEAD